MPQELDDLPDQPWKGKLFILALIGVPILWIAIQGFLHLNYLIPYK